VTPVQPSRSDLPPFSYHRASRLADAIEHLTRRGACAYAGGTDQIAAMRGRAGWTHEVRHLVDIKSLGEAQGIERRRDVLRIGALVSAGELATSAVVRRTMPVLATAASQTSTVWLRRRGTIGGNLVTPHPAGDVATALLALDAVLELAGPWRGRRRITVAELLSGQLRLEPGSLILAVHVTPAPRSGYVRLGTRQAFSRATLCVALVERDAGDRVAVGGVSNRPAFQPSIEPAPPQAELVDALVARARNHVRSLGRTP
jgi:CO/xanthine dehydrogenase FAD-binding subunit